MTVRNAYDRDTLDALAIAKVDPAVVRRVVLAMDQAEQAHQLSEQAIKQAERIRELEAEVAELGDLEPPVVWVMPRSDARQTLHLMYHSSDFGGYGHLIDGLRGAIERGES